MLYKVLRGFYDSNTNFNLSSVTLCDMYIAPPSVITGLFT